jgi:DNA-binding IclR family transcriptional regulator
VVLQVVNVILDLLGDGKWHSLTEVASRVGLHEFKLELVTTFLAEYNFVELDKANRKIRLNMSVTDFLKKIKHIEGHVNKETG